MINDYFKESFRALDRLDEDVFNLNDDGFKAVKDLDEIDDEKEYLAIIDSDWDDNLTDEEVEERLNPQFYLNKAVIMCNTCHALMFKDPAELVQDEDDEEVYNIDDECESCFSSNGYTVIGQIVPFDTGELEVEVNGEKIEAEDDDEEDSIEVKATGKKGEKAAKAAMQAFGESLTESCKNEEIEEDCCEEGLAGTIAGGAIGAATGHPIAGAIAGNSIQNAVNKAIDRAKEESIEEDCCNEKLTPDEQKELDELNDKAIMPHNKEERYNELRKKAKMESVDENNFMESLSTGDYPLYFIKIPEWSDDTNDFDSEIIYIFTELGVRDWLKQAYDKITDEDARLAAFKNGQDPANINNVDDLEYAVARYQDYRGWVDDPIHDTHEDLSMMCATNDEDADYILYSAKEGAKVLFNGEPVNVSFLEKYLKRYLNESLTGKSKMHLEEQVCEENCDRKTEEDFDVTVDDGDKHLEIMQGNVSFTNSDRAMESGEAMIAPFEDEITDEIESNDEDPFADEDTGDKFSMDDFGEDEFAADDFGDDFSLEGEEEAPALEDEFGNEDFEDIDIEGAPEENVEDTDIEEVAEESFNYVIGNYLSESYDNVKSFTTTNVSEKNNNLIVEGNIAFASGKVKNTTFTFKPTTINESLVKFVGENKQLNRRNNIFALKGILENKKLSARVLGYNYSQLNESYKKQPVKGVVVYNPAE